MSYGGKAPAIDADVASPTRLETNLGLQVETSYQALDQRITDLQEGLTENIDTAKSEISAATAATCAWEALAKLSKDMFLIPPSLHLPHRRHQEQRGRGH